MLGVVLLTVWCTFSAEATSGIYRVERQDFSSPSPVVRSLSYQNLVSGRPGVYKVNRQDFAGNAPFSQNSEPPFGSMHGYYYPQQKGYEQASNGYQPPYGPASSTIQPLPRLFVPAESGYQEPNYKNVLSLSEYNRRFEPVPSYSQPSVPSYFQHPAQSQTPVPSYLQHPVQSPTSVPLYFQHPVGSQASVPSYSHPPPLPYSQSPVVPYSQPPVLPYSQPPVVPYSQPPVLPYSQPPVTPWILASTSPTTRLPPTTPPPTTMPTTTYGTYSPLPQAPAVEDDGILSPIPANDEENKPLPPVSAQDSLRKVYVTEDAAGNRHTKVKYHSFDDFVEISDEHRELLESFGSIQNNESDFSELPEASPIRRRRNASHSQVFSMFSMRDSRLSGAPMQDPEQLIGQYVNRLHQQIEILNDMRKAVRDAKLQQSAKVSPKTIVAAGDSTVVVFNDANFDGKVGDQVDQDLAEDLPQSSVPLVESFRKDDSNTSEDLPVSRETLFVEKSTEPEDPSTMEATLSEGSHEVLLQRDEGDAHPTSDPRDQIIYLTDPLQVVTHSSVESWEDSK